MQLRFLKRARSSSNIWPPTGDGPHGLRDTARSRVTGVLTGVRQLGDRLSVTIQFEGKVHIAFLGEWTQPPTIEAVHEALRTVVGKRVWEVGHVEIQTDRRDQLDY